jgi:hypothetical protein
MSHKGLACARPLAVLDSAFLALCLARWGLIPSLVYERIWRGRAMAEDRFCSECNGAMMTRRVRAQFCSASCRAAHWRREHGPAGDSPTVGTHSTRQYHDVVLVSIDCAPGQAKKTYQVLYGATVLVPWSSDPEFDACRALAAQGFTGTLRTRWEGARRYAMTMGIGYGAAHCTAESGHGGLTIGRWAPYPEALKTLDSAPDSEA